VPVAVLGPNDWELPLFLHVLGVMVLVGSLVVAVAALAGEWRAREARDAAALRRIAFGTLLAGALPSYVLMRVGAEWIGSEENVDEIDAAWVDIGYVIANLGLVGLIAATVVAWIAVRRGAAGGPLSRVAARLCRGALGGLRRRRLGDDDEARLASPRLGTGSTTSCPCGSSS
jgi:hypothetical protein